MGSATAATQIEGGDRNNTWFDWCRQGNIKDGTSTLHADDHWNRYREDTALLTRLNQKIYRMGIEWSRIEPEKGLFDREAMERYREEISLIIKAGVRPLVTLHHFSNPLWLHKEGDFENEKVVGYFERYVRFVIENIGDLVSEYITINEPNVYVVNGYFFGMWPPGKMDFMLAMRVYINMTKCHIAAYKTIHELREGFAEQTMVGVANHLRIFIPYNRFNILDHIAAGTMSYFFQDGIVKLMTKGTLRFPAHIFIPKHMRGNYCDFMGINYYTRSAVKFKGFQDGVRPGAPLNDLGWELYPEGISKLCKEYYRKYKLPIWITENGVCDNSDSFRAEYICDHLVQLADTIKSGVRVERYYHWSLLDNFEWLEGESARFGLVHVDYGTQQRSVKRSGEFYADICMEGRLTQEMIDDYESSVQKEAAAM
jgi:beta-glucosidase